MFYIYLSFQDKWQQMKGVFYTIFVINIFQSLIELINQFSPKILLPSVYESVHHMVGNIRQLSQTQSVHLQVRS